MYDPRKRDPVNNPGTITIDKLRVGMRIRTNRAHEMHAPEWSVDTSSNGLYYVNYGKHRVIASDVLGNDYVIDTIPYGQEYFWAYQEYERDGVMHRGTSTMLYDTLVAEILDPIVVPTPVCNCGKDKTGRNDPGPHSSWCNVPNNYISRRTR